MSDLKILRARQVIDGLGGPAAQDAEVVIDGERIVALGPRGSFGPVPPDTAVVELGDATILPGLINCHTHLCLPTQNPETQRTDPISLVALRAAHLAAGELQSGITSVRDMSSRDDTNLVLKRAIDEGLCEGPRIFACGRGIGTTGHWSISVMRVNGPDQARQAVREQVEIGSDFIKLFATQARWSSPDEPDQQHPGLTSEELSAAIQMAHDHGKSVTVHAMSTTGIKNAIAAGADSIEHGFCLDDEGIELLIKHDVFLVPTLIFLRLRAEAATRAGYDWVTPDRVAYSLRLLDPVRAAVEKARKAGVKIAAGSDNAQEPGILIGEIEELVGVGFSPIEAIVAATRRAAEVLGQEDQLGTISPGKLADIIVVDGDPSSDVGKLRDVRLVMRGGELMHRA